MLLKTLSQRHCSPPPDATSMSSWLNVLREQHVSIYVAMQYEIGEAKQYNERASGYASSQIDDDNRQLRNFRQRLRPRPERRSGSVAYWP